MLAILVSKLHSSKLQVQTLHYKQHYKLGG